MNREQYADCLSQLPEFNKKSIWNCLFILLVLEFVVVILSFKLFFGLVGGTAIIEMVLGIITSKIKAKNIQKLFFSSYVQVMIIGVSALSGAFFIYYLFGNWYVLLIYFLLLFIEIIVRIILVKENMEKGKYKKKNRGNVKSNVGLTFLIIFLFNIVVGKLALNSVTLVAILYIILTVIFIAIMFIPVVILVYEKKAIPEVKS